MTDFTEDTGRKPLIFMRARSDNQPSLDYVCELVTVSSTGKLDVWPLSVSKVLDMTKTAMAEVSRPGVISE